MSSESVDEDNLHISNAGSNGQALTKQSGNAGGLTWASAGASVLNDLTDVSMDITNFVDSLLIQTNSDGSAPSTGTLSSASDNVGIGKGVFSALTSGTKNVVIGANAGDAITTSYEGVVIGHNAGTSLAGGERNVAIGMDALDTQSGAGGAVAVGWNALKGANNSYATAIGYQAGASGYGSNSTYVGYQAYGSSNQNEIIISTGNPVGAGANSISIGKNGNRIYANFSSSATWGHSSDERMKKNITDDTLGLSFINRLRPVTYNFKKASEYPEDFIYYDETDANSKDDTITHHGLIAQEVKAAMDAESNTSFKGYELANDGVHSVSEGNFIYPLVKSIQELSTKVKSLEEENTSIKARLTALENA
tara:strand:- start:41 stop:1135 length:1095 start_codon:yes stop_codon:yes gene_type:complete